MTTKVGANCLLLHVCPIAGPARECDQSVERLLKRNWIGTRFWTWNTSRRDSQSWGPPLDTGGPGGSLPVQLRLRSAPYLGRKRVPVRLSGRRGEAVHRCTPLGVHVSPSREIFLGPFFRQPLRKKSKTIQLHCSRQIIFVEKG